MKWSFRVLVGVLTCSGTIACAQGTTPPPSSKLYEVALNSGMSDLLDMLWIPRGEARIMSPLSSQMNPSDPNHLVFPNQYLAFLQNAEKGGLVQLRERQQSALEQMGTQGARFVTVTPTSKLLGLQDASKAKTGFVGVPCGTMKVIDVISEQEFKMAGSTPGDEFRLVLGRMRDTPTAQATVVGSGLCGTDVKEWKFRAVLQFNPFAKTYTFVTADYGELTETAWKTHNIQ